MPWPVPALEPWRLRQSSAYLGTTAVISVHKQWYAASASAPPPYYDSNQPCMCMTCRPPDLPSPPTHTHTCCDLRSTAALSTLCPQHKTQAGCHCQRAEKLINFTVDLCCYMQAACMHSDAWQTAVCCSPFLHQVKPTHKVHRRKRTHPRHPCMHMMILQPELRLHTCQLNPLRSKYRTAVIMPAAGS